MSKTPNYDAKIKTILDATKPGERVCELTGEKWNMTEEEISWYKKFNVPPHPWEPTTRMKQVCSFFVMAQFWYHQHPETGKPFISIVHPLSGIKALPDEEWFGKDFSTISKEVDYQRSFFEQMRELQKQVPIPGTKFIKKPERSIALASLGDVDSYFVLGCRSRHCLYCTDADGIEDSMEISGGGNISKSYHVIQSHRIFDCKFIHGCFDCMSSAFLFDCRNCEYCFGATNKRNRKYLWWNEQLSKEEWERRRAEVNFSCRSKLFHYQEQFNIFMQEQAIWPENFNEKCENTIGEYVKNAIDCKYVSIGNAGPYKDMYYVIPMFGEDHDAAFVGGVMNSNYVYLSNSIIQSSQIRFSHMTISSQNMEYCFYCYNCEDCFGCFGLQRKRFCIFNKPYNEEDYWRELDRIKCSMLERKEYGFYFPEMFQPGYFPDGGSFIYGATKEDAKSFGAKLFDPESGGATGVVIDPSTIRDSESVPDCIDDVHDEEWAGVPLYDKEFKRRFSYLKPELDYYRAFRIAPSTKHFIRRIYDLFREQNSPIFLEGHCQYCKEKIIYTKNFVYLDRKIYCKTCYLKYLEENG